MSTATIQAYTRAIKAFFSWATREEYLKSNPMAAIAMPKSATKIINTFTDDQVAKLTDVCLRSSVNGHRDLTTFLLFLDSGLRVSELVGIQLDDINLPEGYVIVRQGKSSKERIVPFHRVTRRELQRYIRDFRPKLCPCDSSYLFPTSDGHHVSVNSVQQCMATCRQSWSSRHEVFSTHIQTHLRHRFHSQGRH